MSQENEIKIEQEFAADITALRTSVETLVKENGELKATEKTLRARLESIDTRVTEASAAGFRQGAAKALEIFRGFFPPA